MTDQEAYGLCVGGNGKLMKALPLLLADENKKTGQDVLPIKMLSLTGNPVTKQFIDEQASGKGYKVLIKDQRNNIPIHEVKDVHIITGGFSFDPQAGSLQEQLAPVIADIKEGKVKYITSNTFPGKGFETTYPPYLLEMLKAGYDADSAKVAAPIPVFPMELLGPEDRNGDILRKNVLALVEQKPDYTASGRSESFKQWLNRTYFATSLVDRMVAEEEDGPLKGSPRAELFAHIAIEKPKGDVVAPITQPFGASKEIEFVDDIGAPQKRKIGTLNAMHTSMVQKWIMEGRENPMTTVYEFMQDPQHREWIEKLRGELVAVIGKMIPDGNVEGFSQEAIGRFLNPFLNHRLNEIAAGHSKKLDDRIRKVLGWKDQFAADVATPNLDKLAERAISKKQLEEIKKAALAIHDGPETAALFDQMMTVSNPQPQKGEGKDTKEAVTTKNLLTSALVRFRGELTGKGVERQIADNMVAASHTAAGMGEGRAVA